MALVATGALPPRRAAALSWGRLLRHPNMVGGALLLTVMVGVAVFAPLVAPYNPIEQSLGSQLLGPSPAHLFGTDEYGRDIFSRVVYGSRTALVIGLLADGIAIALGVSIGMIAGYFGGRADSVLMRLIDVLLAFPYLLLAMIIVTVLGPSLINAMIAVGVVYTPHFARLVRGEVLATKEREFVEGARASGAGVARILGRHLLPNVLSPIIVMGTLRVGFAIVETAGLSVLGLGAQPPAPEWGSMLAAGRTYMLTAPWVATFPGLAILVTVVGSNLLGDGLRDLLDPRLRGRS